MSLNKTLIGVFIMVVINISFIMADDLLGDIDIFSDEVQRRPVTMGCNPCSAQHGAMLKEKVIVWKWGNKYSCWCGWMFQGLEIPDLDPTKYTLEIVYSGTYAGNPSPQVKFLDRSGNATQIKDFKNFVKGSNSGGNQIVSIPLAAFQMEYSIDKKQIAKIQFDAGWDSSNGDIVIKSVKIKRMKR